MPLSPDLSYSDLGVLAPIDPHEITTVSHEADAFFELVSAATERGEQRFGNFLLSLHGDSSRIELGAVAPDRVTDLTFRNSEIALQIDEFYVQNVNNVILTGLRRYVLDHEFPRATSATDFTHMTGDVEERRQSLTGTISLKERAITKRDLDHVHSLLSPFIPVAQTVERRNRFRIPRPRQPRR